MSNKNTDSDITRLEYLFQRARKLSQGDRSDYLDRECKDPELLEEVQMMLAEDDGDTKEYLLSPVQNSVSARETDQVSAPVTTFPSKAPRYIGEYRIITKIGEGGMGRVYLAQHEETKQRVALKMVRPAAGASSGATKVLERFDKERRVLESMRHPNICRILGGGTYNNIPYFVMEFVDGAQPITEYVEKKRLGMRERLELFLRVCDAVGHGHSRGFLHRDLKPSNLLIGSDSVPKLIDFGVARSLSVDAPALTDAGQLLGTLQYMSPEQLKLSDNMLDTGSDVYSLGILLYELVTGRLPYDVTDQPIVEATRIIQEHRPLLASATSPGLKGGDLETIIEKALEKSPSRRYRTVRDLAIDIDRHLHSQPILARPASMAYLTRLFFRRHPILVGAMAFAAFGLVLGATLSYAWGKREEEARKGAEAMADFLSRSLEDIDPRKHRVLPTVNVLLNRMEEKLDDFADRPLLLGRMLSIIGRTYDSLGEVRVAEGFLRRAVDVLERTVGADHRYTLHAELGLLLVGTTAEAETDIELEKLIPRLERHLGRDHDDTLEAKGLRAAIWLEQGHYAEAEKAYNETIAGYRAKRGELDSDTLGARGSLASLYQNWGRFEESEAVFDEVMRGEIESFGKPAYNTMNGLALLRINQNRFDEAEMLLRDAIELEVENLGPTHPWTLVGRFNLGELYYDTARYLDAEEEFGEVFDHQVRALGASNPESIATLNAIGRVNMRLERFDDAGELLGEAVSLIREHGERHVELGLYLLDYGECLRLMNRSEEALEMLLEAYGRLSGALGREKAEPRTCADMLYLIYTERGETEQASRWRERS